MLSKSDVYRSRIDHLLDLFWAPSKDFISGKSHGAEFLPRRPEGKDKQHLNSHLAVINAWRQPRGFPLPEKRMFCLHSHFIL